MKKKRHAQITIFFLIGIFIVSAFVMVYWLNTRMAEVQLEAPSEKMVVDLLKTGAIPYYVGVCMDKNAKKGLEYIGQQGGNIYRYQQGTAPNPNHYLQLDEKVSYGIKKPYLQNGTTFPEPPGYPGGSGRNKQVPSLDFDAWGRFGEISLRKLCDTDGANSPFLFGQKITAPICLNNIYTDTLSSQWQLEQYVAKLVPNCTNWTAIRQETGYNVTPTGDVNVTVRLGLTDIWIDAYIPLKIEVGGVEPVFTVGDFHTRIPVRLKRIVELASLMTMYDSYQLDFNMSKHYSYFSHYDPAMRIEVKTPMKSLKVWDDIVVIEDSRSVMDGENYVYRFVRENRYPALDLISEVKETNYSDYDIVVMENDTIVIDPNEYSGVVDVERMKELGLSRPAVYDPDEDSLTYYYTGWKETCDDEFDFNIGRPISDCSKKEPTHPSKYFEFPNSVEVLDEGLLHNWTGSEAYKDSRRNATFSPSHKDIGPHNVTVWVCDEAGLCDYQVVRIMVLDYPQLHLNGTNPYDDIEYDKASVEDYYRFSADGTTAYYTPLLGYVFSDKMEPFEIVVKHPLKVLELPRVPPDEARKIPYIHDYVFNRSVLDDCDVPCMHKVNMSVTTVAIPPIQMNVSVYECLPHRDFDDPDAAYMWPYNKTNPFAASHLCCSPGPRNNMTLIVDGDDESTFVQSVHYLYDDIKEIKIYGEEGEKVFNLEHWETQKNQNDLDKYNFMKITYCNSYSEYLKNFEFSEDRLMLKFELEPGERKTYITERIAKNPLDYPPWGHYFDVGKTCYGGIPKLGAISSFDYQDVEHPVLPPPVVDPVSDEEKNDVMAMIYERKCSGNRGNICSGPAVVGFERIASCEEMGEGEIEHCEGPNEVLKEAKELQKTGTSCPTGTECQAYERCIEGQCYETISNLPLFDCKGYTDTTFEEIFNVTREDGTEANGTCNPNPACSDDENTYDSTITEGQYLLKGATCSGGECNKPLESEDCGEYDGYTDSSGNNIHWCGWQGQETSFYTSAFNCQKGNNPLETFCKKDSTGSTDPDEEKRYCDACTDPQAEGTIMEGGWTGTTCCGDDIGEGGYLYGQQGAPTAYRLLTGEPGKGTYGTEICDDYYSSTYDPAKQIDNDCDEDYNCEDNECWPINYEQARIDGYEVWKDYLNENGNLCCNHQSGGCKSFLDPDGTSEGVECNSSYECDCVPVGITNNNGDPKVYGTVNAGDTIRTCVPPADEILSETEDVNDRLFEVAGNQELTFQLTAYDIDGGEDDCGGQFVDIVFNTNPSETLTADGSITISAENFYFKNTAPVDCLVEVKIS